jgi:hypothetical protein
MSVRKSAAELKLTVKAEFVWIFWYDSHRLFLVMDKD